MEKNIVGGLIGGKGIYAGVWNLPGTFLKPAMSVHCYIDPQLVVSTGDYPSEAHLARGLRNRDLLGKPVLPPIQFLNDDVLTQIDKSLRSQSPAGDIWLPSCSTEAEDKYGFLALGVDLSSRDTTLCPRHALPRKAVLCHFELL